MSDKSKMYEDMTPAEVRALDVLLEEVFGKSVPPDLTDEILSQLVGITQTRSRSPETDPAEILPDAPSPKSTTAPSLGRKQIAVAVSLFAALAASLLLAFLSRTQLPEEDPASSLAHSDQASDNNLLAQQSPGESNDNSDLGSQTEPTAPPRGIPLAVGPSGSEQPVPQDIIEFAPQKPSSSVEVTLVSTAVAEDMNRYWNAMGLQPSPQSSAADTAKRLAAALGVELPPESIGDSESIQRELGRPRVAQSIARRWLQRLTQGGLARVDEESRNELIAAVADAFRSKTSFDRLLANWTGGDDAKISTFYSAFAGQGEHQMMRRLASLTMNVDLRCVQCHDSLIEGTGRQQDYWSFAALFRHELKREQRAWDRRRPDTPAGRTYYTLPDGREQLAEPAVAARWVAQPEPITSLSQWSSSLVGSEQLARGVVNSLWQLVHDQPLRGRVIDTVAAPHHESLDRLEQRLTEDLVESQFDIGRTLALIIASPSGNRSVPEALLPENALAATDVDIRAATELVNAFAAASPPRNRLSLDRRIDVAMRRTGLDIDGDNNTVLAQGSGNPPVAPNRPLVRRPEKGGDFPSRATSLPVQWISNIDSERSQIEHLGYLSGMSQAPEKFIDAAEAIRGADEDWQLTLQRVWWLVRPQ
jgi:hypothetical protein